MHKVSTDAQAVSQENRDRIRWGWVIITGLGMVVAVTLAAFVWVAIYSYLIHPGEELSYYQNYAQFSSPIVSIVVGIPLWFFACRWVGRKAGTRAVAMCVTAWLIVPIIDVPLSLLAGATASDWVKVAISDSTKLLAAYLGGRAALSYVHRTRRVS